MPGQLEEVTDRVAEIIRRVGKREEVEDEVASNINFSGLAEELVAQEGPVRDAAIKVVASALKNLEIESGSDLENTIIEGIDFKVLSTEFIGDPEIREALKSSVKTVIENCDSDTFHEAVEEAFGLTDSDKLVELLDEAVKEDLGKIVVKMIQAHLQGLDIGDLDSDIVTEVEEKVFTSERIASCLSNQATEINEMAKDCVLAVIKAIDSSDVSETVTQVVLGGDIFKTAINDAMERLVRSGKIDRLVEESVSTMFSRDDSVLRTKIGEAVSDKLVGRIADSMVSRLFEQGR